jgi:hypothetical protein
MELIGESSPSKKCTSISSIAIGHRVHNIQSLMQRGQLKIEWMHFVRGADGINNINMNLCFLENFHHLYRCILYVAVSIYLHE